MSRKTNPTERNYESYELEVLAIIEVLKKFRVYLLSVQFKIVTDCADFTQTIKKKDVSPKIWRWAEFLESFDYVIEHRPDTRMKHVDAMNRNAVMAIMEDDMISRIMKE